MPEEIRQKCRFYGQQASERILCPEPVFRGFLVSTLTCQDCHHTSSRHENFLDISLPVCAEKPAPPIRRKSSPEEMNPNHEELAQKHKNVERHRKQNKPIKPSSRSSSSSGEESDADVEDNLNEDTNTKQKNNGATDTNGNIEPNSFKTEKEDNDPETKDKDKNGECCILTHRNRLGTKPLFFIFDIQIHHPN